MLSLELASPTTPPPFTPDTDHINTPPMLSLFVFLLSVWQEKIFVQQGSGDRAISRTTQKKGGLIFFLFLGKLKSDRQKNCIQLMTTTGVTFLKV